MPPIVTDRVAWAVCRCVTVVSPAKTAEPIEMSFGWWASMGPRNHALDGVQKPPWERVILEERGAHWSCAKTAEPIDLPFGLWTRVSRIGSTSSIVFARWRQCAVIGGHIGATWQIRLNHLRRRCGLMSNYVDHLFYVKFEYRPPQKSYPLFL